MIYEQTNEMTWELTDLYYETITGLANHDDVIKALVLRLKDEGFSFELLQNEHVTKQYERLMWTKSEKPKAIASRQFEHASDLRSEEIKLMNAMANLVYFTRGKEKTMKFVCMRKADEWILG